MQAITDIIMPVFGIILAGYLCGRWRLLGVSGSDALNGFVYFAALPALFFGSIVQTRLADIFNWPFILAYAIGMSVVSLAALGVGRLAFGARGETLAVQNMAALFANTGYMGIPLCITTFGPSAALPAIVATIVNGAVVMALYILWIEVGRSGDRGRWWRALSGLTGMMKSPLVLSALVGLLVSGLDLPVPASVLTFCDILGQAAPPAALFAMGLFMVGRNFAGDWHDVAAMSGLKLILHPLATLAALLVVPDVTPSWRDPLLVLSALPTGSLVFVLAARYQVYTRRATGIILATTLASLATLSWILVQLGVR